MLANFASGGAAVAVLARAAGAELVVVDAGVVEPFAHPGIRDLRLGAGTANAADGPAMSREQAEEAVRRGSRAGTRVDRLRRHGRRPGRDGDREHDLGRGARERSPRTRAGRDVRSRHGSRPGGDRAEGGGRGADARAQRPRSSRPAGRARSRRRFRDRHSRRGRARRGFGATPRSLLDGFITGTAALVASRLVPELTGYLVASHLSPGARACGGARRARAQPLLDLGLRLGEGSGAALALPLLSAARAILVEMATFEGARVTDTGR